MSLQKIAKFAVRMFVADAIFAPFSHAETTKTILFAKRYTELTLVRRLYVQNVRKRKYLSILRDDEGSS